MRRYEILLEFVKEQTGNGGSIPGQSTEEESAGPQFAEKTADCMIYDLYLRENLKSRPSFGMDQKPYEKALWEYRRREKVDRTAHIEVFRDGRVLLFDYSVRDPLTHNASVTELSLS